MPNETKELDTVLHITQVLSFSVSFQCRALLSLPCHRDVPICIDRVPSPLFPGSCFRTYRHTIVFWILRRMALPSSLRNNFSPLELEFVTEEEFVEIKPSVRLAKTRLLSGVRAFEQRLPKRVGTRLIHPNPFESVSCESRRSSAPSRRRMQRKCRYG